MTVCCKSIREDVKCSTANGLTVVGDRKWCGGQHSHVPTFCGCKLLEPINGSQYHIIHKAHGSCFIQANKTKQ